ncbi:MAG TPA: hypothetical protein VK459_18475 [Polyangiaceae bacterium]|nr:hypothetical protein [Polyangiaceae bacterium]
MTKPQTIAIAPSMSEYFQEVVQDAMRVRNIEATRAASTYLVSLLCEFAHPDEEAESPFKKPLTFLLHDALEATGPERFRRLRTLGDGVLYGLGFFGSHIEMKGIDRGYVVDVGTSAYIQAAAMLRKKRANEPLGADVLAELSSNFERFVQVLADVAEGTLASAVSDGRSLVKLYERWLKTGSSRLAGELATRGILPHRSPSGGLN